MSAAELQSEAVAAAVQPAVRAPAGHGPRPLQLRTRLVLLVLSVLMPALLVTGVLLWSIEREAYRTEEQQLATTARTLALVVDGRLGEQVAALQALSVSPLLRSGDWRGFSLQARMAMEGSDSWVVVRTPDGQQYVNTHADPSQPLPLTPDRAIGLSWAGHRGTARVSNLFWGPLARAPVVVVTKPLRLDGGRAADLSVVTPAASFTRILQRQGLPAGWTATILDGQHRVVGRNRAAEQLVGRSASADMLQAMSDQPRGVRRSRTLDGIPTVTAFDQLPGYQWAALVAMPREEAAGAAGRAILVVMAIGALLLTGGVLMALRMGRRIAWPVESLAEAAQEWVEGREVKFPPTTGLEETDHLSRAFAAALEALQERDGRRQLLINELNHRVKNTLATVQSVALHTRRGAASVPDYHSALEGRVIAMSHAHEILTRSSWEGAELGDLARATLRAFASGRLRIEGPPAKVNPTDALNLSLIFYELATNAAKHGALSTPEGEVSLSWRIRSAQTEVSWVESGGPRVEPPRRQGFGSRLIARAAEDLKPSDVTFAPEGLRCRLTLRERRHD
jgi:two-component sensor histidine kinase